MTRPHRTNATPDRYTVPPIPDAELGWFVTLYPIATPPAPPAPDYVPRHRYRPAPTPREQ